MANPSSTRRIFDLLFWGGVAAVGYFFRNHPIWADIASYLTGAIGPYAGVAMFGGALTLLFMLFYLNSAIASTSVAIYSSITGGKPLSYEGGNYEGTLVRSAKKLEKRGDYTAAAEVYESLNAWPQAAHAYERAGLFSRAAGALEQAGEHLRAIDFYEREENFEMAASLSATEGLRDRSANNYRKAAEKAIEANSYLKGADFYERGNEYEKAGKAFEVLQKYEDALRCYEKAGAASKIETLFSKIPAGELTGKGKMSLETVRRAAELVAKSGRQPQAAEALEAAGDYLRAAEMFESAGEWERAGEAYLRADLIDRAENAYQKVQDRSKVAEFLARIATQKGEWQSAGEHYEDANKLNQAVDSYKRAKDFKSAARLYETMKRYLMAAEMYSAAKESLQAAEAYAKGNDWRNAGECYEQSGSLTHAIEAFATAGNYFRAGVLSIQLRDFPRAIEYLQRVSPNSTDHRLATGHLATAFFYNNRIEMARELFRKVIDQINPAPETLSIYYAYGRLLETENPAEAIQYYQLIMSSDLHYSDVADRITKLENTVGIATRESAGRTHSENDSGVVEMKEEFPTVRTRSSTETGTTDRRQITQAPETRFGEEGRYQIIEELGRGGMAIVYKAFDQHLEREVALKTFPLSRHSGPGREEIFLNEARLIARLSHPNIVTIFDSGHMNYLYYIAMEYISGENLKHFVKRKGPLSMEQLKTIFKQLAEALKFAHAQQVLHRDVKPGNVIIREGDNVKVVDFGLAKLIKDAATDDAANEDSQRTLVGTPQYMAPEQIMGASVDVRTDVYSLGLTLFYSLTGRTPFEVKKITDPIEISRMQINTSFPRPSTLRATLPPAIDDVFVRCTQKNPADRYPNVQAFLEEFALLFP